MELGVQRLILPAVPSVLNTWTGSFGFSKMTDSERLEFVDYTFLDFQDTIMCQKLLMRIPSAESSPSKGLFNIFQLPCLRVNKYSIIVLANIHVLVFCFAELQPTVLDDVCGSGDNIGPDGSSSISEVLQTHQRQEGGIVEGPVEYV